MSVARIYDLDMAPTTHEALTTAEELLLLALDPRSGELRSYPALRLPAAIATPSSGFSRCCRAASYSLTRSRGWSEPTIPTASVKGAPGWSVA